MEEENTKKIPMSAAERKAKSRKHKHDRITDEEKKEQQESESKRRAERRTHQLEAMDPKTLKLYIKPGIHSERIRRKP